MSLRQLLSYCLSKAQSSLLYRAIARLKRPDIIIEEASQMDMQKVYRWLNPKQDMFMSYNPNATNFVAKKNKKVIGFIQLAKNLDNSLYAGYWLFGLAVKIYYRRMGIGKELAQAVIKKAQEENAQQLSLLVRETNNSAIRLYKNLGFEIQAIPALEEKLEEEKLKLGYRRIAMSRSLCKV